MSDNKFRLNTEDVLGFAFQEYLSSIRGMAISEPARYYKLRAQVMKQIKRDAVGALYKTIFNALTEGTDKDGTPIGELGRGPLIPMFPSQKTNDLAIRIASILGEELNKVVDIILPDEFETIASKKLAIKGAASSIDVRV